MQSFGIGWAAFDKLANKRLDPITGVVTGRHKAAWQDREYVLGWFGRREGKARKAYRKFVKEGITLGRRPELVGGGLVRSVGGWSEVVSLRRQGVKEITDERKLGSGDFVERVF